MGIIMNNDSVSTVTTNSWVQVWKRILAPDYKAVIRIQEIGSSPSNHAILYRVVTANEADGTDDIDDAFNYIKAVYSTSESTVEQIEVSAGGDEYEFVDAPWYEVAVYVKSSVDDAAGTVKVTVAGG
jgi:hypothetical protein